MAAPTYAMERQQFEVMAKGNHLSSLVSPALRRAFSSSLLLHVLGVSLFGVGVYFWPKTPPMPVPAGVFLDVAEALSPVPRDAEHGHLERAMAKISPESREAPSPEVPEAHSAMSLEPRVMIPAHATEWIPSAPEVGLVGVKEPAAPSYSSLGDGDRTASIPATLIAGGSLPIALSKILPHYPYGARVRGEAGQVSVWVHVNESGSVESAVVLESSGFNSLDNSAIDASRKARFKPAERDGKSVAADMNLQFEFRLEDR